MPNIWGSNYWFMFHVSALSYPDHPTENDIMSFYQLYSNFWRFIPCKMCSDNYRKHIKIIPIEEKIYSRDELFKWTVDFHNIVNDSLNKPTMSLSYAYEYYKQENLVKQVNNKPNCSFYTFEMNLLFFINIIVILSVVACIIYLFNNKN